MKKKLFVLMLLLCMAVMMLPATAYGANAFEFRYKNDDPNDIRIGIKSIVIDGTTYYDLYDGDPSRTAPNSSVQFLQDVLTKPDNTYKDEDGNILNANV